MKKRKFRFLKVVFLTLSILFFVGTIAFLWFFIPSLKTKLQVEKFKSADTTVSIFCDNETKLENAFADEKYINYSDIPQHVVDSFVCLEDKRFFEHQVLPEPACSPAPRADQVNHTPQRRFLSLCLP